MLHIDRKANINIFSIIMLFLNFLLITMIIGVNGRAGNDMRSRGSGTYTPSKKSQTICRSYPALTKKQMMLCRRHPDIAAEAIKGIQKGISACQNQMRNRRWNCSELQTKNGNPYTHPIMRRACDTAIAAYVEKKCKCHGMSGSCQLKTCWMQSPDFGEVAKRLYNKYQSSIKVRAGNKNGGNLERSPASRKRRIPPQSEVVYLEQSPHFCEPDAMIGSAGTQGRLCNKTDSSGMNSCNVMCCGRGYNEKLERRTHPCNCTFMWCCDVKCQNCETETLIATCK
ncbi:protein Wnt-10a-like [Anneissia japonica]|uniref:protein Wnt-10a-like n=1 Tax=Anneissia japonica TaxID=1529436 RepID=UPI00142554F6|nr:protein Wnt-10a-like [Anneissia japonica]